MRAAVSGLFEKSFGRAPALIVRSPGRVNLIGDHTDYNDGFVLPMALDRAVWIAATPRSDRLVRVVSSDLGEGHFDLDDLARQENFVDYLSGPVWAAGTDDLPGLDLGIAADLPVGAGLSSSAALEVGTLLTFFTLAGREWNPVEGAIHARRAENKWVGVASGIMDQLIVAVADTGHATLIDCRTLETVPVPLPAGVEIVVLDSATRRRLATSAYNERRQACQRVAASLGVSALRDANLDMLERADLDPIDLRRGHHVITENDRVLAAVAALEQQDIASAGKLMNESHLSLRDDFEVSTPALDALVEAAWSSPGCLGARLTGAGMGGCAVALISSEAAVLFIESVSNRYTAATGRSARVYQSKPAQGAEVVWTA